MECLVATLCLHPPSCRRLWGRVMQLPLLHEWSQESEAVWVGEIVQWVVQPCTQLDCVQVWSLIPRTVPYIVCFE